MCPHARWDKSLIKSYRGCGEYQMKTGGAARLGKTASAHFRNLDEPKRALSTDIASVVLSGTLTSATGVLRGSSVGTRSLASVR